MSRFLLRASQCFYLDSPYIALPRKNFFANYFARLITVDDRAVEDGRPVLHDIAVHGMLSELRKPLLWRLLARDLAGLDNFIGQGG